MRIYCYIRAGYDEQTVEDRHEDTVTSEQDMRSRQWRIGIRIPYIRAGYDEQTVEVRYEDIVTSEQDMRSKQWRIGIRIPYIFYLFRITHRSEV